MNETFIKMADCHEIQEVHDWQHGDWFYPEIFEKAMLLGRREETDVTGCYRYWSTRSAGPWTDNFKVLWLPTPSQLQAMSGLTWYMFDKTCVTWATVDATYQNQSKEVVGIQVVMHELHGKVWNGESWVKHSSKNTGVKK